MGWGPMGAQNCPSGASSSPVTWCISIEAAVPVSMDIARLHDLESSMNMRSTMVEQWLERFSSFLCGISASLAVSSSISAIPAKQRTAHGAQRTAHSMQHAALGMGCCGLARAGVGRQATHMRPLPWERAPPAPDAPTDVSRIYHAARHGTLARQVIGSRRAGYPMGGGAAPCGP